MVAEELKIVIKAESNRAQKSLRGVEKQSQKTTKSMDSMKKLLTRGLGFAAAAVSVGALTKAMKASIDAYGQQITAERTLAGAIEATGENADELLPRYKDLASEIQSVTTVGDESTLALMQQAQSMGISSDKMEEATKGAIGLSKAFGMNTRQAIKGVANAMQGNFQTLQRYIPALRTTEDESEKMALVQKAMADGFKVAESEADSAYGSMQQLGNSVGDLQEELGENISKGLEPFTSALNDMVGRMIEGINRTQELKDAFEIIREDGNTAGESMDSLTTKLAAAEEELAGIDRNAGIATAGRAAKLDELIENLKGEISARVEGLRYQEQAKNYAEDKAAAEKKAREEIEKQNEITSEMNKTAAEKREEIRQEYGRELELLNASSDKERERMRLEFERADALAEAREEYVKTGEEIQLINDYFDAKLDKIKEEKQVTTELQGVEADLFLLRKNASDEYIEKMKQQLSLTNKQEDAAKQLADTVAGDLRAGFESAFAAMGEAIVNGDNAMKAFGKSVVLMFADMLKAIGEYLTTMAVAYGLATMWGKAAAATAGAAAAYASSGAVSAAAENAFYKGGVVDEPVIGVGQRSGESYSFGERGPETVTPGAGGDSMRVTVNLDKRAILDAVTKGSDNGDVIINSRAVR